MGKSLVSCFLTRGLEVEHMSWVGESLRLGTDTRTNGRTSQKHIASGPVDGMIGGIEYNTTKRYISF